MSKVWAVCPKVGYAILTVPKCAKRNVFIKHKMYKTNTQVKKRAQKVKSNKQATLFYESIFLFK